MKGLDFQFISDDGREVTYRAVINDSDQPLEPVFALTVITGSPRGPEEQSDLQQFLGQVTADFALVGPTKDQPPSPVHRRIPFHPRQDILFIAEIVTAKAAGGLEAEFEVRSSMESATNSASGFLPSMARLYERWKKRHIYKRKQRFQSASLTDISATVTCSRGAVKVSPGPLGVNGPVEINAVSPTGMQTRSTEYITVRPDFDGRSTFTIHASFIRI